MPTSPGSGMFATSFLPLMGCPYSSATNQLITAKDHASVQFNVGLIDENGAYIGEYKTVAFSGFLRKGGGADQVPACSNRPSLFMTCIAYAGTEPPDAGSRHFEAEGGRDRRNTCPKARSLSKKKGLEVPPPRLASACLWSRSPGE